MLGLLRAVAVGGIGFVVVLVTGILFYTRRRTAGIAGHLPGGRTADPWPPPQPPSATGAGQARPSTTIAAELVVGLDHGAHPGRRRRSRPSRRPGRDPSRPPTGLPAAARRGRPRRRGGARRGRRHHRRGRRGARGREHRAASWRWPRSGRTARSRPRGRPRPLQLGRERGVEVALVHPLGREVAARAGHGDRVGVGGVHLGRRPVSGESSAEGGGAAAQVDHHVGGLAQGDRDDQLAPSSRHEHPGVDRDPHAREGRPADDVLERLARHPAGRPRHQLAGRRRLVEQEPGLLLGEDAPGRPERGHELGLVHTTCPRSTTAVGSRSTVRSARGSRG